MYIVGKYIFCILFIFRQCVAKYTKRQGNIHDNSTFNELNRLSEAKPSILDHLYGHVQVIAIVDILFKYSIGLIMSTYTIH